MSRNRFTDAADVFAAFPLLERYVARPAGPRAALDYARVLSAAPSAVAGLCYLAHLLPRREAIWWGCQCVGAIMGAAARDQAWTMANQWVRDPDEAVRREALNLIQSSDLRAPSQWLARAVAYSGGSILAPDQPPMPPSPEACALSVNAAIVLAATTQPPAAMLPWMRACAEAGVRFAEGEDARVDPPKLSQPQVSPQ